MALTLDEYKFIKRWAGFYSWPQLGHPRLRAHRLLDKKCKFLGWGSDRSTYAIQVEDYEPVAFKISDQGKTSQGWTEAGIYQRFWKRYPQYIPRVFDWCESGRWIEVEILRSVTRAEMLAEHGFSPGNAKDSNRMRPLPGPIRDFASDTKLLAVEMDWLSHWGRSSDGRIKLRDFGTLDT